MLSHSAFDKYNFTYSVSIHPLSDHRILPASPAFSKFKFSVHLLSTHILNMILSEAVKKTKYKWHVASILVDPTT